MEYLERVPKVLIYGFTIKSDNPTTNISLIREGVGVRVFWESIGVEFTHKLGIEAGDRVEESSPPLVEQKFGNVFERSLGVKVENSLRW